MSTPRTALITGGSRGIGRAIALALSVHAQQIAIFYAGNQQAAEQTVSLLTLQGVQAMCLCCDVSDPVKVKEAVQQVRAAFGPIGILVNNAGINKDGLTLRMTPQDFDSVLQVNLAGAFHCIQACYRDMMQARWGRILNITSVAGLMGNPGQANYASAKAGLVGLTKTIARELATRGVTCNAIAPGFIDTDMTQAMDEKTLAAAMQQVPMGHMGKAEDIASAAAFLCSEAAGYITGTVLQVDGGMYM
jgi:3-oxoacyl-[acyl-carrier protein] reductase